MGFAVRGSRTDVDQPGLFPASETSRVFAARRSKEESCAADGRNQTRHLRQISRRGTEFAEMG